jgi:hypothetical protein
VALGPLRIPAVSLTEIDLAALALAALAIVLTFVMQRSMIQVIAVSAVLGLAWRLAGG